MNLEKNFWANKKVLITGHTGFKGSWLSLWLLKYGACVYGYSLSPTVETSLFKSLNLENYAKKQYLTYQSFEGDIRNKDLLRKKIKEGLIINDFIINKGGRFYLNNELTGEKN